MVKLMSAMVDALRTAEELYKIEYPEYLMHNAYAFESDIAFGGYREETLSKLEEYDTAFDSRC
jgi:hypothetical protein